jgi:hypothetical protein
MKKDLAVSKNLDLINEFMRYAFDNPEVLERIPPEAELLILPTNDPELYAYNKKRADRIVARGGVVVLAKMKKPEIPIPELEVMSGTAG